MNWWLMALAFVLGAVLTAVFTVRRVKREVPVYESAGAPARLVGETPKVSAPEAEAATTTLPKVSAPDVDAPTTAMPRVSAPDADTHVLGLTATAATAAAAGGVAAAKFAGSHEHSDESPYGAGSFRGTAAPSGYDIKGNEDSMLYHTTDSPSYQQTIAEVWFNDEGVAERAGFTRWDRRRAAAGLAAEADLPPGPHGPGSAVPADDGSGPTGWTVKGNEDSMLYHSEESPSYGVTRAEVWFRDVETAEAAGFNRWDSGKSQRGLR